MFEETGSEGRRCFGITLLDDLWLLELLDREVGHRLRLEILLNFGLRLGLHQLLAMSLDVHEVFLEWLSPDSLYGVGGLTRFTIIFEEHILQLFIRPQIPLGLKLHRILILRLLSLDIQKLKSIFHILV